MGNISIKKRNTFFTLKLAKKKKSSLGVSVLLEPGNGLTALNFDFLMIFQYYPFYEVRKEELCFFPPKF